MGTITKQAKKATQIKTNDATETMAKEKKTREMAQTPASTDTQTRQKKLLKARNNTEPAYKPNHSPTTPQDLPLWGNTPSKITTTTTNKIRKTKNPNTITIVKKKTHEKFRELISIVKFCIINNS